MNSEQGTEDWSDILGSFLGILIILTTTGFLLYSCNNAREDYEKQCRQEIVRTQQYAKDIAPKVAKSIKVGERYESWMYRKTTKLEDIGTEEKYLVSTWDLTPQEYFICVKNNIIVAVWRAR